MENNNKKSFGMISILVAIAGLVMSIVSLNKILTSSIFSDVSSSTTLIWIALILGGVAVILGIITLKSKTDKFKAILSIVIEIIILVLFMFYLFVNSTVENTLNDAQKELRGVNTSFEKILR